MTEETQICPVCRHVLAKGRDWHPQIKPDGDVELHFVTNDAVDLADYLTDRLKGWSLMLRNRNRMRFRPLPLKVT